MHRKPHLETAHAAWRQLLKPGDTVIDATCGNGHDALLLAQLVLTETQGHLIAIDIQLQALANTKALLSSHLSPAQLVRVQFIQGNHEHFPNTLALESVKLIVYNLGYLPGGDKAFTTQAETTLRSIQAGLHLVEVDGCISITCYPGHPAGAVEEQLLMEWVETEIPGWSYKHYRWLQQEKAPSLILLSRLNRGEGRLKFSS